MKKILIYIMVVWVNFAFAQYTEWHVQTIPNGGSPTNQGTESSPWDLQTALNNPSNKIKPGDVVWLHNGVYTGHYTSSAALSGTATQYITVASYPGEWAVLNGNIYSYVEPPQGLPNVEEDPNALPATIDQEMSTYLATEEEDTFAVLLVEGGYVQFKNFEISCLGNLNRLFVSDSAGNNCDTSNGFHKIVGISHSVATANKFTNLVIRNIPGEGIGSWKYTDNTEIYGCIIYYNGYILNSKSTCASTSFSVVGKGPGIYSQNEDATLKRIIKNNIILNNYDSGFFIWSATSNPGFDYLRSYDVTRNVFINNGSPQRDETANIIIKSNSGNSFNHPYNINVDNNIFYFNSRTSNVSGIDLQNSSGVTMTDNSIFKGTAGVKFTSNNTNLDFQHNMYFGKRLQTIIDPTTYAANNWTMDNNSYFTRSDSFNMFEIAVGTLRYSLPTFQSLYADELNSTRLANTDISTPIVGMINAAAPQKTLVTQNQYNPNLFYVTIFNPRADLASTNTINVDFSSYGIPNGKVYRITDAENYFGAQTIGTVSSGIVPFPMTLTTIEPITGVLGRDYITNIEHTLKDLHVFTVYFGCDINFDEYRQNINESSTVTILAKNRITLGTNYIANNGSDITAKASRDIKIIGSSHLKSGSKVHLKIEDPCPDLNYVGEGSSSKMSSVSDEVKTTKETSGNLIIYPNPNSGIFNVENGKGLKIQQVIASDINKAEVVFDQKYHNEPHVEVDISSKPSGIYVIDVFFEDGTKETQKIIKK
ncbi:T9SS type A sorting domain-containing protein [Flavobacterium sp. 25HG05S-40]|uniref:T9SS type A sorting domain-containing protein n=1 Tax=Flavobacterium sp. 25HG05S-40 TaxID=3458682 RepID=UPI0040444B8E